MKKLLLILLSAACLAACGGGSSSSIPVSPVPPVVPRLVGEIFSSPSELATSELKINAGYAGNLPMSRAIQASGKTNLLDLLFMHGVTDSLGNLRSALAPDAEQKLIQYASDNKDLLVPGIRVLITDEVFWTPSDPGDSVASLERQLVVLKAAIALVRKHIPQSSIGITVTPYAAQGHPNTLAYSLKAVALVDWVGTDPYWLGDPSSIPYLHSWSRTFNSMAKLANPKVETWFIAQAFKFADWDLVTFNSFVAEQLGYADQYDHILFFGWQYVSEIDSSTAGKFFPAESKALYKKYLKP